MYNAVKGFVSRLGFASSSSFSSSSGFSDGGVNPPLNSIFYWPFFTGSLDETIEGIDATLLRDSDKNVEKGGSIVQYADNVAAFDDNGLNLESAATNELENSGLKGVNITDWQVIGSIDYTSDTGLYDEVNFLSNDDRNYTRFNLTLSDASKRCFSVFVKNLDTIQLSNACYVAGFVGSVIDDVLFNGVSYSLLDNISGSGLIELLFTPDAGDLVGDVRFGVGCISDDTGGGTFYLPQLEKGIRRTSDIITPIGATATRAADDATNPVSTSQVDDGVYLGDLTTGGWVNGVNIGAARIAFLGSTASGKYEQNVTADWDGSIAKGSNGVLLSLAQVSAVAVSYTLLYNPTSDTDDDAIQAGFENTGDSSNLFTIYFHTSGYTLADVKALRLSVGDGSTWVDTPVNDFCREVEFYINYFDNEIKGTIYRGDTTYTNYEFIGYTEKSGNLSVGYAVKVGALTEALSVQFTPSEYDITKPFIVRTEKRSGVSTTLTVIHNGLTFTDIIGSSQDIIQQTSDTLNTVQTVGDTLSHTIVSSEVGAL